MKILYEIRSLNPYFTRREKLNLVILLILMILGALIDVFGIGAIPVFVAIMAVPDEIMKYDLLARIFEYYNLTPGSELVTIGALILLVIYILKNIFLVSLYNFQFRIVEHHRVNIGTRLFRAYMRAPYLFITDHNSAELLRNVNTETQLLIQGVIIPLLNVTMGILMSVFTFSLLLIATPTIAIVGVLILGLGSAMFLLLVRKKLQTYGAIAKEERKQVVKAINQGLGVIAEARIYGRENYFENILSKSLHTFAKVTRKQQVINRASPHILETIAVTGLLTVIVGLIFIGNDLNSLLPILALFGAATIRLKSTIANIVSGVGQIQYYLPCIKSIVNDLKYLEPQVSQEIGNAHQIPAPELSFKHTIELKNISFTYNLDGIGKTLDNISIEIQKGMSVGFVGATGSGKSTLINIILTLIEAQEGQVLIDGKDIAKNKRAWLNNIGYIPQEIYLVDDTILRNIAFGWADSEIDMKRVWRAIKAAQLDSFISSLPNKDQTIVGERGIKLSGGQKQRIGIARALYNEPEVIIMDEATSALDNKTENQVMNSLNELQQGRTFIIIAHRLSTVQQCDVLYFLEDGRIKARGSFNELLEKFETFKTLVELS